MHDCLPAVCPAAAARLLAHRWPRRLRPFFIGLDSAKVINSTSYYLMKCQADGYIQQCTPQAGEAACAVRPRHALAEHTLLYV